MTMAVDDELAEVVQSELHPHDCALLDVVDDELADLADGAFGDPRRALARRARARLGWLGEVVDTTDLADLDSAREIQDVIAGGRPLRHDWEHWAESVIITVATGLTDSTPMLLTEDHGARIEARAHGIGSASVHKLLSTMVIAGRLDADVAVTFADRIHKAGRAFNTYTAEEFRTGDLGRLGRP